MLAVLEVPELFGMLILIFLRNFFAGCSWIQDKFIYICLKPPMSFSDLTKE